MIRNLTILSSAAALILLTSPASATDAPGMVKPTETVAAARPVFVCAADRETRRAFAREHGEARFMTADQIADAAARDERWSIPRCIREDQLIRYQAMVRQRAQVRVAAR